VFDKLRKVIVQKAAEVRETASGPSDLHAVPATNGQPFDAIPLDALSAYLGREALSVSALGALGPTATSALGRRFQERLREQASGQELEPGELIPGQRAAMEERMRAEGASEEMLAMIRARIDEKSAERTAEGGEVEFTLGHRASVQLFDAGTEGAGTYDSFEHRWDRENGTDGHRPEDKPLLSALVHRSTRGPYETYCLSGRLAAKGSTHVAIAQSAMVSSDVLIGLATLALRTVEPL
jgi:hypothetical protein